MGDIHAKFVEHRERWQSKPVLRRIYEDFYRTIFAHTVPGNVLEIGSGSGHMSDFAEDVVQIDILPAPWLDLVADAQRLPFSDCSFDNIVMLDVLHHIQYPALFLQEAQRILRPGGRFVALEPGITPVSWLFYNFVHEEDVDLSQDPLKSTSPSIEKKDAWHSNQALPTLLFARRSARRRVQQRFPALTVRVAAWCSLWAYPLSGGFQGWSLIREGWVEPILRIERRLLRFLGPLAAFRILIVVSRRPGDIGE